MGIIAGKYGPNQFYIRQDWGGMQSCWRLKIFATPSGTESGVLDFVDQRAIPTATPQNATRTAYNSSVYQLRGGNDESPAIGVDGTYYGGNHRVGGLDTVSMYALRILGDGVPWSYADDIYPVLDTVSFIETYVIPTDAGLSAGKPWRGKVRITRTFDQSGMCHWEYRYMALAEQELMWVAGMQCQRPITQPGHTLHLMVPKTNLAAGIDITNEHADRFLPPEDWDDPTVPPSQFIQEIRTGGLPFWRFVMGFEEGQVRPVPDQGMMRSAADKMYPRFLGPRTLHPGEVINFKGYFGSYVV